jgi:glycosyltransferase involved in cell wall biosynthesis
LFHNSARPYVIKLHTPHRVLRPYYSPREAPYARRGIEALEKFTIRRASGLSSPSRTLAKDVARLCGLDESRIICVPNPIDTDFFSPGPDHENDQIVLYVGRLEPRKGAVVFAHAIPIIARACPGVRFLYAGVDRSSAWGHSQKAELEQYLNQEGLADRVRFQGHASPEVFREYYRRATVFVMPSLFENCPYTLLEAMACGKAVVASRAGGMPEMVAEGESGLLFEAGNSDALAEAVIALLNSPARRARLGAAARRVVEERYALNVAAEATLSFYRRVLAERANR